MSNPVQVADTAAAALNAWGRVDIPIINAGILRGASFAKMTFADFQTVINVHLISSAVCAQAVLAPHARRQLRPHPRAFPSSLESSEVG